MYKFCTKIISKKHHLVDLFQLATQLSTGRRPTIFYLPEFVEYHHAALLLLLLQRPNWASSFLFKIHWVWVFHLNIYFLDVRSRIACQSRIFSNWTNNFFCNSIQIYSRRWSSHTQNSKLVRISSQSSLVACSDTRSEMSSPTALPLSK